MWCFGVNNVILRFYWQETQQAANVQLVWRICMKQQILGPSENQEGTYLEKSGKNIGFILGLG